MSEYFRHFILPRRSQIGLFHLPFPLLIINLANVFHRSVLAEVSPSVHAWSSPVCPFLGSLDKRQTRESFRGVYYPRRRSTEARLASTHPSPSHVLFCGLAGPRLLLLFRRPRCCLRFPRERKLKRYLRPGGERERGRARTGQAAAAAMARRAPLVRPSVRRWFVSPRASPVVCEWADGCREGGREGGERAALQLFLLLLLFLSSPSRGRREKRPRYL